MVVYYSMVSCSRVSTPVMIEHSNFQFIILRAANLIFMMTSLNPSLMTGTGTVDCGRGLWPQGSLVIVSPLKSCGNDAFVDLHPWLQWIKTYKRENKGTKELQIRPCLWWIFVFTVRRNVSFLRSPNSANENRNFTGNKLRVCEFVIIGIWDLNNAKFCSSICDVRILKYCKHHIYQMIESGMLW